jgi:uncharacterized glyoxalase superfamily protein PhnB
MATDRCHREACLDQCDDIVGRTVALERSGQRRPLNLREVTQLLDKGLELLWLHEFPCWQITSSRIALHHVRTEPVDEMPEWGALSPKSLKGTPVTVHLYVDDVDAVFKRAVKAGATPIMAVADTFWGDRYGVIEDPFGHRWSIATHLRDMTAKEIQKAIPKEMMCP